MILSGKCRVFVTFFILSVSSGAFSQESGVEACGVLLAECSAAMGEVSLRLSECSDLRAAKRECGVEKGSCKIDAQEQKNACLVACSGRQCRRACKAVYKTAKRSCRNVKDSCINDAIANHRTPQCEAARNDNWKKLLKTLPACLNYEKCAEGLGLND